MRERIDDPFILFDFPVHVRPGRRAGHADERDGLAAGDALADGHERSGRVVVTALDPFGVLHAHPAPPDLDPARAIDHTIVRGDDDRAEGRGDINPGMAALQELADRAGDGTNEAARSFLDAPETRARCWIVAETAPRRRRPSAVHPCTDPARFDSGTESFKPSGSMSASLSSLRTRRVSPRGDHSV